ncbi:18.1 kDa class I heat shock protein-like isoform X1 [Iris pallida]|uniref:18.1 kDa class I heat shock protein-like isoform X1 n=1 Tax=Iris pallida TaxID=29817 RepID=A0AAX6GET9_IRIPA|nr:18.1 kDa class I heat shock protein-like isoform X1 [Iris pallida]
MSLSPFGFGSRILDPVSSSDLWDLRFPVDSSLPIGSRIFDPLSSSIAS